MSAPSTHALSLNGGILGRGFWLYVWEITAPEASAIYYVGGTGDSSSINAQSPFNRMGRHLGFNANSNVLRRHLEKLGVRPEECRFNLVTHGPLLHEVGTVDEHRVARDMIATLAGRRAGGHQKTVELADANGFGKSGRWSSSSRRGVAGRHISYCPCG